MWRYKAVDTEVVLLIITIFGMDILNTKHLQNIREFLSWKSSKCYPKIEF